MRTDRGPLLRMQRTEAALNPHLTDIAPRLLRQIHTADWHFLVFEYVKGRPTDLGVGSTDLERVADTLTILYEQLTPAPVARTLPLAERWSAAPGWAALTDVHRPKLSRWAAANLPTLLAWEHRAPGLVSGDTLAHTDLSSSNFHLTADGRILVLDWAWPASAAPWVDTAFTALRLIGAGHHPADAEYWAASVPVWSKATPDAVTAFAVAVAGVRALRCATHPAPHLPGLASAAERWVRQRLEAPRLR
ncbi:Ser/Thr protein kinase RdoA (MazF antagonist) [Kitasatospora gansuensis]|uniref:Ser/Thr protein kinase RdoA (MazF antagonist) n=1 Tax=Kitasatospora gansuensis TaxID=258050 RepID=A0A7W7SGU2_9ACTN|nr:hypothetical protein [Kitasatospora gansuensis]MBB4950194.1 Ser/Thr protein kinase RdoA (MazF antagonist) [Kitasatospora gansuensis]